MKKILAVLFVSLLVFSSATLFSCGKKAETVISTETEKTVDTVHKDTVSVFTLKGPTGMGMAQLMNSNDEGTSELKYNFTVASSPEEITAEIVKGNFDIAALPVNLASVLYNKAPDIVRVAALNTEGVLSVLENGNDIKSVNDLNGKKIYATGKGSTPEYILNYILDSFGIECSVEYIDEHSELASMVINGSADIAVLPAPSSTTALAKNSDVRRALDLTELFNKAAEDNGEACKLYQGCIVINSDFEKEFPEDVKAFLDEYDASVFFVNEDRDAAAEFIAKYDIIPSAEIAKSAIDESHLVCITGKEMKDNLSSVLGLLFRFSPSSVGGALPGDEFYYISD